MTPEVVMLMLGIGFSGGAWNVVAGGATLFALPALMAEGLPPVVISGLGAITGSLLLWCLIRLCSPL